MRGIEQLLEDYEAKFLKTSPRCKRCGGLIDISKYTDEEKCKLKIEGCKHEVKVKVYECSCSVITEITCTCDFCSSIALKREAESQEPVKDEDESESDGPQECLIIERHRKHSEYPYLFPDIRNRSIINDR